jgi:hypothetical protein
MLLKNYLHIGAVALKTGSKCSFIGHKLRFSPCYCHVSAVSNTFANSPVSPAASANARLPSFFDTNQFSSIFKF